MNDEKLKVFLNSNSKVPEAPAREWPRILLEIESQQRTNFFGDRFRLSKVSVGFASFAAISIIVLSSLGPYRSEQKLIKLKEIDTFLASDSYFNEGYREYSWVEDL